MLKSHLIFLSTDSLEIGKQLPVDASRLLFLPIRFGPIFLFTYFIRILLSSRVSFKYDSHIFTQ
jgi:hypothetical protein